MGRAAPFAAVTPAEKDLANWWTVFDDKILQSLIQQAVESNLDLKLLKPVCGRPGPLGSSRVFLGPTLDATGSYQRSETSVSRRRYSRSSDSTVRVTTSQYFAGFDAAWELDIFGGRKGGALRLPTPISRRA